MVVVLIIGLSLQLFYLQYFPDDKEPQKGLDRGTTEQLKMPLKGLY